MLHMMVHGAPPALAHICNLLVHIPDLLQVSAMIARANELVAGWDPELDNKRFSVFTTKEEQTHAKVSHSFKNAELLLTSTMHCGSCRTQRLTNKDVA
jgi:hypothetical protein